MFLTIDPLRDPVTWYGINYTGTQITQWDFQNKGTLTSPAQLSFVLKSHCVICVPVQFIPYHVTGSCKGPFWCCCWNCMLPLLCSDCTIAPATTAATATADGASTAAAAPALHRSRIRRLCRNAYKGLLAVQVCRYYCCYCCIRCCSWFYCYLYWCCYHVD